MPLPSLATSPRPRSTVRSTSTPTTPPSAIARRNRLPSGNEERRRVRIMLYTISMLYRIYSHDMTCSSGR
eukprot:1058019-Pleurochrysis_carterae.AAC.2